MRDTGIGIPLETQGRLFHAFVQADSSTTRQYGGTGLGLAICSRLVPLMGGTIRLVSAPGAGSTFHFTIDYSLAAGGGHPPAAGAQGLDGVRVLVVDGNATTRAVLEALTGRWGMLTESAASAPAGLTRIGETVAARQPFRVVLLDEQLALSGGPEFVERFATALAASGAALLTTLRLGDPSPAPERLGALAGGLVAVLLDRRP